MPESPGDDHQRSPDVDPDSPGAPDREVPPGGHGRTPRERALLAEVTDADALLWADLPAGLATLRELTALYELLLADVAAACTPVPTAASDDADGHADDDADDGAPAVAAVGGDATGGAAVSDAVLVEALAAAERCLAHVGALRDVVAGVFAARRQAEAEADAAAGRAASSKDGRGRPWAAFPQSTAPTEVAARLGVTKHRAGDLLDRGTASLRDHLAVHEALLSGAVSQGLGSWLLDELVGLRADTEAAASERELRARTARLQAAREPERREPAPGEDDAESVPPPPTPQEQAELDAADRAAAAAAAAAAEEAAARFADAVAAQVRTRLLARATAGGLGIGTGRTAWTRALASEVSAADPVGSAARATAARTARSVTRWSEKDGQGALLVRAPADDIALIGTAMDARAKRRQADARAAEKQAAAAEGRPFDRRAVGSIDQHRVAALTEWATAALELAGTSGASGTWHPVARTAASRPVVSLVMPLTIPLGVTTVGAHLVGYGPVDAETALRIAGEGFWRRVFTDPVSGVAIGVEEAAYRPTRGQRRLVELRHPTSTMPGSTRPAGDCDIDHIVPWAPPDEPGGGATTVENLQPLARPDHLLKQAGDHAPPGRGWRAEADPSEVGGVVWRSPTSHLYAVPARRLYPGAVDDEGPDDGGRDDGGRDDGLAA